MKKIRKNRVYKTIFEPNFLIKLLEYNLTKNFVKLLYTNVLNDTKYFKTNSYVNFEQAIQQGSVSPIDSKYPESVEI